MKEANEYFECFRMMLHVLKMFGIFPFIFLQKDTSQRLLLSRTLTVVSIIAYFIIIHQQILYISTNLNLIVHEFNYTLLLRMLPSLTIRSILILMPFMTWNKYRLLHNHWNNWRIFQHQIEQVKGIKFFSSARNKVRWMPVIILTFVNSIAIVMRSFYRTTIVVPPGYGLLVHTAMAIVSANIYWYINCLFTRSVAEDILLLIQNVSKCKEDESVYHNIMKLWLTLSDLNHEFNSIHSVLFLIFFACGVLNMVTNIYSFFLMVIFDGNQANIVTYLATAFMSGAAAMVYCECGNALIRNMVRKTNEAILSKNTTNMNANLLNSIVIFLDVIEAKKPKITLNGFTELNRGVIITIITVSINYLIVFKQFDTKEWI